MIVINGETVDPELIEETFMRVKSQAEAKSEVSCCERDEEFRARAEDEVIEGILLAQEAERRIPEPGKEDVRAAFEEMLREWRAHGASWELIEAEREELRGEVVARLRMERFAADVWRELPEPDEAKLRAWHAAHQAEFHVAARAKVLHLIRFPGDDPAAEFRRLVELRGRILDGADFAETARAHTAKDDREIDLGWIEHERLLNTFETMLFSLREREVSPVFYYENALHLVWIETLEPEHVTPFEEVRDKVREQALAGRRHEALRQVALKLRETATIEHV